MDDASKGIELRSLITEKGQLRLSLDEVAIGEPEPDEVVVRVEAAPINPSDLGVLLGPADMSTLRAEGTAERPVLTASIQAAAMMRVAARMGQSLPVGNEGAGTVVRAGAAVSDLLGRKVGIFGGGMYTQLRKLRARDCILLPEGVSAAEGASIYVNPMTALAFVEAMKAEGHKAIVHTAAASNLGQMLNRICIRDGIKLVNIVRRPEQAALLRDLGASWVVDSSSPDFEADLLAAVTATEATLAFDAIGGGGQASIILNAMETAANSAGQLDLRYGSGTFQQVYVYGALDLSPIVLDKWLTFSWSVEGWLLPLFLKKLGAEIVQHMRQRVLSELTTTFASHYTAEISLADMLQPGIAAGYQRKATGEKYLVLPNA